MAVTPTESVLSPEGKEDNDFVTKANQLSQDFFSTTGETKKILDSLQGLISTQKHDELETVLPKLNPLVLFFLARSVYTNKPLAIKYLNLAYETGSSNEYVSKNVLNLAHALVKKDPSSKKSFSPKLLQAIELKEEMRAAAIKRLLEVFTVGAEDAHPAATRNETERKNFLEAATELVGISSIETYTPEKLWELIQKVHAKLSPNSETPYDPQDSSLFVTNVSFFEEKCPYSTAIIAKFNSTQKGLLANIKAKVNAFIKQHGAKPTDDGTLSGLQETIMVNGCYFKKCGGQSLVFFSEETAFIKRHYDIKMRLTPQETDKVMIEGLRVVLNLYKDNPFKAAAHLSMLIAHKHPFWDGNGRTARLFMAEFLRRANFPSIRFPNKHMYDLAVREAEEGDGNYDHFENFLRQLMDQQHKQAKDKSEINVGPTAPSRSEPLRFSTDKTELKARTGEESEGDKSNDDKNTSAKKGEESENDKNAPTKKKATLLAS